MVVGEVLVTPCEDLLTRVSIGSVAPNTETGSRETRVGKSRGRHCKNGWVIG